MGRESKWIFKYGEGDCGLNKTTAKLDDGSIVYYDLCQKEELYISDGPAYDLNSFEFIGFGFCIAINDKPLKDSTRYAFFKRK